MKPAKPGLWAADATVLINGVDVMAQMRNAQAAMLQSLPPDQRAPVEAAMGGQTKGASTKQCISAAQAAHYADPQQWLAELRRQQPKCTFELGAVTGNTVNFTGRCNDPKGFTGTMQGQVVQADPTQYRGTLTGRGTVASIPAAAAAGDMAYDAQFSGRWLSADCGALAPRP